jgi:hypothetical protein
MAFSVSMVAGLSGSILNRGTFSYFYWSVPHLINLYPQLSEAAIKQIETDLKATSNQISPVLAAHIILQGVGPVLWTSISEVKGRKVRIPLTHALSPFLRIRPCNP